MKDLEKIVELALKVFDAQELGDARAADRYSRKMRQAILNLYKNGEIGQLRPLMYHEHDAVKCEVAIKLLPFFREEAENVLGELAEKRGNLIYATAKTTLEEWRKGNIKFP